jgi:hypothetical protein
MSIVNGTLRDDGGAIVNVMNDTFGAVGDGVTDDADAIHAAAAHAAALGGAWVMLPRVHRLDDDLVFDDPRVGLQLPAGAAVRPAEGRLVRVSAPLDAAGPWIDLSLGGEVDFSTGWSGVAHAEWWGAKGDGVTDNGPALAAAALVLARSGGTLVFAPGTYHVATDVTFHASVSLRFLPGAVLKPGPSTIVTLNGPPQAGHWRWIDTGAGGQVRFGKGTLLAAPPQWWGAKTDGATDAAPAFLAAAAALDQAGGGTLVLGPGVYHLASLVILPPGVALEVMAGASVRPAETSDLLLQGPVQAPPTHWIDRSLEGRVLFERINSVVLPQWWGAVADGTADCAAALTDAVLGVHMAISGTVRIPAGQYAVASEVELDMCGSGLLIEPGAVLKPASGVTVGVAMPLTATGAQWIDSSDGGKVVIRPASRVEIIPQWWGAEGDGLPDDGPALRLALESIAEAGGGRLFLPAGHYAVEDTVTIPGGNVRVEGVGDASVLHAAGGGAHLLRVADGASSVSVAHLRLIGCGASGEGPGGVHAGEGTSSVWVEHCTFEGFGDAGATDHSRSSAGGVRDCVFRQSACGTILSGIAGSHDVSVSGCDFEDVVSAVIVRFGSGSLVTGNSIRYTGAFGGANDIVGIRVFGQGGTRVIGNQIDARGWALATELQIDAGIRLGIHDPASSDPQNGFPNRVLVMGNLIRGGAYVAIELLGANGCDVVHNQIESLPTEWGVDYGIVLAANQLTEPAMTPTTHTSVSGNRVDVSGCGCGTAIEEMYCGSPQGNAITGNPRVSGPTVVPLIDVDPASDAIVRDNGGFATAAAGTATVAAGDTSVSVATGLAADLSPARIIVTPLSSLGVAARFWVSNVDASNRTFDITVDAAPGGAGAEFAWRVMP